MIEGDRRGVWRRRACLPRSHKDVYYRVALSHPDVGEAPYAIGALSTRVSKPHN